MRQRGVDTLITEDPDDLCGEPVYVVKCAETPLGLTDDILIFRTLSCMPPNEHISVGLAEANQLCTVFYLSNVTPDS